MAILTRRPGQYIHVGTVLVDILRIGSSLRPSSSTLEVRSSSSSPASNAVNSCVSISRWLFCLMGLVSFVLGLLMLIFLPDKPSNTWWLTSRQRAIAVERIARGQTGIKSHVIKWYQVKEAASDSKTWLYVPPIRTPHGLLQRNSSSCYLIGSA